MTDRSEGQGFRSIGSLLPTILHSQRAKGSMQEPPPNNFATTGTANLPTPQRPTGGRLGGSGAERKPAELVADALEASTEGVSKAALRALLQAQLGSLPVEVSSSRFGEDGQFEPFLEDVRLPVASAEALASCWRLIEPLCRPANASAGSERAIVEEWTRLKAVTIGQAQADPDSDLATDTILDELARYPADCVIRALRAWRQGRKWRPSLAEILAEVQWRARYRQCLRAAFERAGVA